MPEEFLFWLWWGSILMICVSIVAMLALILWRISGDRQRQARSDRRQQVFNLLMFSNGASDDAILSNFVRKPRDLANLVTELSTVIKGRELQRVVDRLRARGAVAGLLHQLKRGNREDRLAACEALSFFDLEVVATALMSAARRSKSLRVRIAALRAALQMGNTPSLEDILKWMAFSNREVPVEFLTVLQHVAGYAPHSLVESAQDRTLTVSVRAAMMWALAESGHLPAVPVIENLTRCDAAQIRAAALAALAELGFVTNRQILLDRFNDESAEVRRMAASAAARLGDEQTTVAPLQRLLSDEDWEVRFQASQALARFGDTGRAALREEQADTPESLSWQAAMPVPSPEGTLT
jgi:ABC-type multidrug transport system fused ATPase/permease subunit